MDGVVDDRFPPCASAVLLGDQTLFLGLLQVVPHEPEQRSADDRIYYGPDTEAPSEANAFEYSIGGRTIAPCDDKPRGSGVCNPPYSRS